MLDCFPSRIIPPMGYRNQMQIPSQKNRQVYTTSFEKKLITMFQDKIIVISRKRRFCRCLHGVGAMLAMPVQCSTSAEAVGERGSEK